MYKRQQNNILKQQAAANFDSETLQRLTGEGFDLATAKRLIEKKGVAGVERQLDWLDARKPDNRLAMLRKAIEDDWAEPAKFKAKAKIAQARKRDTMQAIVKQAEEGIVAERKQRRQERKRRLLAEWELAEQAQRAAWIDAAISREPSTAIQKILAKQNSATAEPHFQVLDVIAFARGLPSVTDRQAGHKQPPLVEQPQQPIDASDLSSFRAMNPTPQEEKMPTEMASF